MSNITNVQRQSIILPTRNVSLKIVSKIKNLFVSAVRNVTLENVTTTLAYWPMDVDVNASVKISKIAGIGSCARIIAKMNVKVLSAKMNVNVLSAKMNVKVLSLQHVPKIN